MDLRSLVSFARIKPLAAWSLSAALLGVSLAIYLGGTALYIMPMVAAIACVILMQYVAHPMNDIMDLELDKLASIAPTGRIKPIADGSVSVVEAKHLSLAVVAVIVLLLTYLIALQPVLLLPAAYGMIALIGYNHPSTRWAYGPFTELYLSMPINAISVAVIAFIGSGALSGGAVVVSLMFGFASSTFFLTMMSMDYRSDRANGKMTTIASYPRARWCTYYPLLGLAVAILGTPILAAEMGVLPALAILALATIVFSTMSWMGDRADRERIGSIEGGSSEYANRCRLHQLYLSIAFSAILSAIFFTLEVA